jgi:dTDP-4-amino-4,6-dideoxygalactose transaminase
MSVSDLDRHAMSRVVFETYPAIGFNYRLSDILATLGLAQMSVLDQCLTKRRTLALRYNEALGSCPYLRPPLERDGYLHSYQSYMVRLTEDGPLSREALMQALLEDGIATRRGVMASHLEPPYELPHGSLPNTERIASDGILLPLFPDMSDEDQRYVIGAVLRHLEGSR